MALLLALYPEPDVPKLERKWEIWNDFATRRVLREPVPTAGLEPAWACAHRLLKTAPQPIGLRRLRHRF